MDPKSAMILGLVMGIMGLCTIGFFILLNKMLKGGSFALGGNAPAPYQDPGNAPSQPNPTPSGAKVTVGAGHFPIQGKANAPVTVIEFADFRCPFCERFYKDAEKSVMRDYVASGKVKYAFRHFAFLGPQSTWAGEAVECANEQGKFWQMHDWLYDNQASESDLGYYSKENLIKYAAKIGVNTNQFASCLNSDKYAQQVAADTADGQQAGVNGTPTTFVNGTPIVGAQPYSAVKAAIDAALAGK